MGLSAQSLGTLVVRLTANTLQHNAAMDQAARKVDSTSSMITKSIKRTVLVSTAALISLGGASIKAATDFESSFTDVIKTVNATSQEIDKLKSDIRGMSKELPTDVNRINAVASAAGQLGIQTKSITSFTRTMLDLGETTNLAAEQAATELARFANITQMSQGDFDRLGSTVVALGNSMATTEAEIVEMAARLAGAGTQIGMTESQIMGLSAALSSVGINAEAGGSSLSKVLMQMADNVASGSEELEYFASASNKTVEQFTKDFQEDASGALVDFLEGMNRMAQNGGNVFALMDQLGFQSIRVKDALLRASGAGDMLRNAINLGTSAWEENNALTKEAELRYSTFASKVQILWNQIKDLGITVGEMLLPLMEDLVSITGNLVEGLDKLSEPALRIIVAFGAMLAAGAPILLLLLKFGPAMAAVAAEFAFSATNFGLLATATATLIGPLASIAIIGVAAATAIVAIADAWYKALQAEEDYRSGITSRTRELVLDLKSAIEKGSIDALNTVQRQSISALAGITGEIEDINKAVDEAFRTRRNRKLTRSYFEGRYPELKQLQTTEKLLQNNIRLAEENIDKFNEMGTAGVDAAAETTNALAQGLTPEMMELIQAGERLREALRTPFEEAQIAIAEYQKLLDAGVISMEEFRKASAMAMDGVPKERTSGSPDYTSLNKTPTGFDFSSGPLGFQNTIDDYLQKNSLIAEQNRLFSEGLVMEQERAAAVAKINSNYLQTVGILKPLEAATLSLQNNMKGLIQGTVTWKEALNDVAASILSAIINAFIEAAAQALAAHLVTISGMQALSTAAAATVTATSAATAGALGAAWLVPAMLANIATLGGAAGIGAASFAAALAAGTMAATAAAAVGGLVAGLAGGVGTSVGTMAGTSATQSFAGGGWTGDGARSGGLDGQGGFMAMLHPQEEVVDYAKGGNRGSSKPNVNINVYNMPGQDAEVRQSNDGESFDVYIRKVEEKFASDLERGTGKINKALGVRERRMGTKA